MEAAAEEAGEASRTRPRHIKKRSLKNKALSVAFDEKDLNDYVTGFHKRKKKRRKEAELQLQEAQRRKRIEQRKKRKLERQFAQYGGVQAETSAGPDEGGDNSEQDEESEPVPSVSVEATTMYDNGDVQVMVTTSEISREEQPPNPQAAALVSIGRDVKKQAKMPVKKKPFKRVANKRYRRKPQNKRDKNKEKKRNKKR